MEINHNLRRLTIFIFIVFFFSGQYSIAQNTDSRKKNMIQQEDRKKEEQEATGDIGNSMSLQFKSKLEAFRDFLCIPLCSSDQP